MTPIYPRDIYHGLNDFEVPTSPETIVSYSDPQEVPQYPRDMYHQLNDIKVPEVEAPAEKAPS